MKHWFKQLIKKIEAANKKNFGNERLDCCDANQKSNQPQGGKKR